MTASDISNLRQKAEAGNPRAQYMLAATLSASGAKAEADKWLRSAAELGEPDAGYTLATRLLQTSSGAGEAAATLETAALNGSTVAERLLGVLYAEGLGVDRDRRRAVKLVLAAAKSGDMAARRELAMLLLLRDRDDPLGILLLTHAAERDAVAAAVYARRAIEGRSGVDAARARAALNMLTRAQYPNAAALAQGLSNATLSTERSGPAKLDWDIVAETLVSEETSAAPTFESLCEEPEARVARGAFPPELCEYVIAASAARLAPSHTTDPRTGALRRDAYRTSLTATLGPVDLDLALLAANRHLAALAGRPHENGEFLSVLRYAPGQEYRPHYDWLPSGEDFDRGGQRITTALLYLNDAYDGGETHFLTPAIKFRGAAGDVLVFHNARADGAPDKASRHASLPVKSGAKWIGSKWFREKKYTF